MRVAATVLLRGSYRCGPYRGAPTAAAPLLLRLLGRELDHVVDAQHGDGGLGGELDHLDLGERGLDDARGEVVLDLAWPGLGLGLGVGSSGSCLGW